MKAGNLKAVLTLLAAALLVFPVLPAGGQGPASPGGRPLILEFGRKACPICHKIEMTLKEVQGHYSGQVEVRFLYIDEEQPTFHRYRVVIVPTVVFLDAAGKEVFRHEGPYPRDELLKKLKDLKFIKDLAQGAEHGG